MEGSSFSFDLVFFASYLIWLVGMTAASRAQNPPPGNTRTLNTLLIESITGLTGTNYNSSAVNQTTPQRTDIGVAVEGMPMPPFMGLISVVGIQPTPDGFVVIMGDPVLFQVAASRK
jgi:hypothetical protein